MKPPPPKIRPRLLLIEDSEERIMKFRAWVADTPFVLVEATTGGQAMGVVQRDAKTVAGICLDHDLNTKPKTTDDEWVSGSNVVTLISNRVPRHVPILVHSMNVAMGNKMETRLTAAGFTVTRIRMTSLDRIQFTAWLETVEEQWDEG